jgi:2-polyprenyl-3-methyl-5-hydroxy-6-metoxy-1,4-benzoquinol methylase
VDDPRCIAERYRNDGNLPLLDLLPAEPGRVLDCGCGAGDNARILTKRGWVVTGITISLAEARTAATHCQRVVVADLEHGLPSDVTAGYDVVLMSHVLEHLVNPQPILAAAKRVLRRSGLLAVALPNVVTYSNRWRVLRGSFNYTSTGIMDQSHARFYTFQTGATLLRSHGFRVVVARADGSFPLWKTRQILPPPLATFLNRAAVHRWPGLFGFQSLYLARPVDA